MPKESSKNAYKRNNKSNETKSSNLAQNLVIYYLANSCANIFDFYRSHARISLAMGFNTFNYYYKKAMNEAQILVFCLYSLLLLLFGAFFGFAAADDDTKSMGVIPAILCLIILIPVSIIMLLKLIILNF